MSNEKQVFKRGDRKLTPADAINKQLENVVKSTVEVFRPKKNKDVQQTDYTFEYNQPNLFPNGTGAAYNGYVNRSVGIQTIELVPFEQAKKAFESAKSDLDSAYNKVNSILSASCNKVKANTSSADNAISDIKNQISGLESELVELVKADVDGVSGCQAKAIKIESTISYLKRKLTLMTGKAVDNKLLDQDVLSLSDAVKVAREKENAFTTALSIFYRSVDYYLITKGFELNEMASRVNYAELDSICRNYKSILRDSLFDAENDGRYELSSDDTRIIVDALLMR